jgi:hypothetical protein
MTRSASYTYPLDGTWPSGVSGGGVLALGPSAGSFSALSLLLRLVPINPVVLLAPVYEANHSGRYEVRLERKGTLHFVRQTSVLFVASYRPGLRMIAT